jgi:hypothetical protein
MFPSFVAAADDKVAWLSFEELRIFSADDLIEGRNTDAIIAQAQLTSALGVPVHTLLPLGYAPLALSKQFALVLTPSAIVGFFTKDAQPWFRFPFAGRSIVTPLTREGDTIWVANTEMLYRFDLSHEEEPKKVKSIRDIREALKPTPEFTRNELLGVFLQRKGSLGKASRLVERVIDTEKSRPNPSQEANLRIAALHGLVYELQVMDRCVGPGQAPRRRERFKPPLSPKFDAPIELLGVLQRTLQLRAFSDVGRELRNHEVFAEAACSPLLVQLLFDAGREEEACDSAAEVEGGAQEVHRILSAHRRQLGPLFQRVEDQRVAGMLAPLLPYLQGVLPADRAFAMMGSAPATATDQLVMVIALSSEAGEWDQRLSELIGRGEVNFTSPRAVHRHLEKARMYRSAAQLSFRLGMWRDAALYAKQAEPNMARQLLRQARISRLERFAIATELGIQMGSEDAEGLEPMKTKVAVIVEVRKCVEELERLAHAQEQSLTFLHELEQWTAAEAPEQRLCAACHIGQRVGRAESQAGHRFPCGHVFHDDCLRQAVLKLLGPIEAEELASLCEKKSLNKRETERREVLLAGDCPACGLLAVEGIRVPIPAPAVDEWALEEADLQQMASGRGGRKWGSRR